LIELVGLIRPQEAHESFLENHAGFDDVLHAVGPYAEYSFVPYKCRVLAFSSEGKVVDSADNLP
jgi:hypothetical protein